MKRLSHRQAVLPLALLLMAAAAISCSKRHETMRSAYYWSTVFDLDSAQKAFLSEQQIGRIYLRFFDVVMAEGRPLPNATVQFASPKPEGVEVVPTVFIVNDCLLKPQPGLDSLLLGRILQMAETHDMGPVGEIQIDCDWTKRTRSNFFDLMERLHRRAKARGITLSATIRLHQLDQPPPPADRGVLMMYNTGDVTKLSVENPILDMDDVKPYLHRLKRYALRLSTAYPVFEWQVIFRDNRYVGILHKDDPYPVMPGDSIVHRQPTLSTVMAARRAIDSLRPDANDEVILYEISKQNIKRINQHHYEKVFSNHARGTQPLD